MANCADLSPLASIGRRLPRNTTVKHRIKRVARFIANQRIEPGVAMTGIHLADTIRPVWRAMQLDPDQPEANALIVLMQLQQGQKDEAMARWPALENLIQPE